MGYLGLFRQHLPSAAYPIGTGEVIQPMAFRELIIVKLFMCNYDFFGQCQQSGENLTLHSYSLEGID